MTASPAPGPDPLISVIIVAYQSGPTLGRCLDALAAQDFRDFETLVADNASPDGVPEKEAASRPWVRLLAMGGNLGFAAANNRAAAEAKGEWLVLLNPDAYAEPGWLAALARAAAAHPGVDCFTSLQLMDADPTRLDGAGDVMTSAGIPYRGGWNRARRALPAGEVFSACGAAMMIRREVFLALGGFDEGFFCYCEDVDLGYRLRLAGGVTRLVPDAVVRHVGSATTGVRSDFAIFHGGRNRVWTYVKNTPPLLLVLTLWLHVGVTAGLLLLHLRRGDAGPAWRGIVAALKGLRPVLAQRRAVQAGRKVGSGAILGAMALDPIAFLGRRWVVRRPEA